VTAINTVVAQLRARVSPVTLSGAMVRILPHAERAGMHLGVEVSSTVTF